MVRSKITRRDFLNGAALTIAAGAMGKPLRLFSQDSIFSSENLSTTIIDKNYYPPTLTGLRGSHAGAYETAHALAWSGQKPAEYIDLDEEYDLVIVGAGISGLAAAYFFQQQVGKDQRILLLDNHDDFGGHAKRNEFHYDGQMLLGFGGAINLQFPDSYSDEARTLVEEIGIDFDKLDEAIGAGYTFADLSQPMAYYFDKEKYGESKIVKGDWMTAWQGGDGARELIAQLPIPAVDRERLTELVEGEKNYLEDISLLDRWDYLHKTSYRTFMQEKVGLSEVGSSMFDAIAQFTEALHTDSVSIAESLAVGSPGLRGMGWLGKLAARILSGRMIEYKANVLPDGNSSVARLMVRKLIPGVAPGNTMEDVITTRFDYSQLDQPGSPVRLRLNSTVVNVSHEGKNSVAISYVQGDKAYRVKGGRCIMACYNGVVPYLCPELPEAQKEGLKYTVKPPFVYTNVLLRSGEPYYKVGAELYHCAGSFFSVVNKAPPTKLGDYQPSSNPDDPMVLFLGHAPATDNDGTQTGRDLYRQGRYKLLSTPFATYEEEIRKQLTGMFAATGFDADRDIKAITVNRWSHGWAYDYKDLYDPEWPEGEAPHEIGRKPFGRITIANSDSENMSLLNGAVDAAWRSVQEQLEVN